MYTPYITTPSYAGPGGYHNVFDHSPQKSSPKGKENKHALKVSPEKVNAFLAEGIKDFSLNNSKPKKVDNSVALLSYMMDDDEVIELTKSAAEKGKSLLGKRKTDQVSDLTIKDPKRNCRDLGEKRS